jgi:integrase
MTALDRAVDDYLELRRSLGFKLERHGRLLADFVAYLEAAGAETVTTALAVSWASRPVDGNPAWWSQRLGIVRGFACYLRAFDPGTEVPPTCLLPRRSYRPEPYIYLREEVASLMAAARAMANPLRAATLETLIGLVASCGLRPGEALNLDRDDVEWSQGVLDIRNAKFNNYAERVVMPTCA